jgi:hypothetical protein
MDSQSTVSWCGGGGGCIQSLDDDFLNVCLGPFLDAPSTSNLIATCPKLKRCISPFNRWCPIESKPEWSVLVYLNDQKIAVARPLRIFTCDAKAGVVATKKTYGEIHLRHIPPLLAAAHLSVLHVAFGPSITWQYGLYKQAMKYLKSYDILHLDGVCRANDAFVTAPSIHARSCAAHLIVLTTYPEKVHGGYANIELQITRTVPRMKISLHNVDMDRYNRTAVRHCGEHSKRVHWTDAFHVTPERIAQVLDAIVRHQSIHPINTLCAALCMRLPHSSVYDRNFITTL